MLDRSVMSESDPGYIEYIIGSPAVPPLKGIIGVLDLDGASLYMHEAVMASAVAARSADIERAGAFLEPVVVATPDAMAGFGTYDVAEMRSVMYGDERHTVGAISPVFDHHLDPGTDFVVIDGHHRIAAVHQHAQLNGISPSILALVVDVASPGLFVVPQHRVLGGHGVMLGRLPDTITSSPYRRGEPVPAGGVAIVSHDVSVLLGAAGTTDANPVSRISSVTLAERLLEPLDLWVQGFATRETDAYAELESGACGVAIMGDLAMEDIVATATAGIVLPEKTTCFSPKVAVGLVGVTAYATPTS